MYYLYNYNINHRFWTESERTRVLLLTTKKSLPRTPQRTRQRFGGEWGKGSLLPLLANNTATMQACWPHYLAESGRFELPLQVSPH